jgi:nitrogen fixation-related uncharacterized protein
MNEDTNLMFFLWLLWKEQYNDDDDEENYIHI